MYAFYILFLMFFCNFISKHIQNGFVRKKAQKISKTFCEDHIGISIFFYFWHFYATGLQSFAVQIGPPTSELLKIVKALLGHSHTYKRANDMDDICIFLFLIVFCLNGGFEPNTSMYSALSFCKLCHQIVVTSQKYIVLSFIKLK